MLEKTRRVAIAAAIALIVGTLTVPPSVAQPRVDPQSVANAISRALEATSNGPLAADASTEVPGSPVGEALVTTALGRQVALGLPTLLGFLGLLALGDSPSTRTRLMGGQSL